jgi:GNAT superfamily N-acetyltransferase
VSDVEFREGRAGDLRAAFGLFERAIHHTARHMGAAPSQDLEEEEIERNWGRERPLVEFIAAQEGGSFWLAEDADGMVGFARTVRFGRMEQLTEVAVAPPHHRTGVGRALLERCWPGSPTPTIGRLVVAAGSLVDLSLYPEFGVMPVTGHWHLEANTERYLERRSQEEVDSTEAPTHLLSHERAATEWKRLEPAALGHERPLLHEFFARERTCLACLGEDGRANGLCWVGSNAYIGPGVGERAEDLVPVTLAALDRVAKAQEPETLHVFCTTDSWWLLRRLRAEGFRVSWPSWVMCSEPLPALDRYLPTRPALIL